MREKWLPVPGVYRDRYSVSNLGRVKSSWGWSGERILKAEIRARYLAVTLTHNKKATKFSVHSLVALAFIGPRPIGRQVNHKDGVKTNNSASNLNYVTQHQNILHAHRIGLGLRGEKHRLSKLTDKKVIRLRELRSRGATLESLSKKFKVSLSVVQKVAARTAWSHV